MDLEQVVLAYWVAYLLGALIGTAVFFGLLYAVVRTAVFAALQKHERVRSGRS